MGTTSRSHSQVIMQQSKVIMWSICLFSSIGRLTQIYTIFHQHHTGNFPWHWICMNTNANSQHECASTKDIWLKAGFTSPEMWHHGWCVENEPNYRSTLMGNISPQQNKKKVIILCSCNITPTVWSNEKRWNLILWVCRFVKGNWQQSKSESHFFKMRNTF